MREPMAVPVRWSSWSISINFVAIHSFATKNCPKNHLKSIILGFIIIDVDIPKQLVASACYFKQHVCAYLQPFSH